jgi:hypothetical protein
MTNSIFSQQLKYLKYVVGLNTEDVSQDDSLISAPNGGNCANWIMGHIVVIRDGMRKALGLDALADEE